MWSRDFKKTGTRLLWLLGEFVLLIACGLYIEFLYQTNLLPDKKAKQTYLPTKCYVVSKKLTQRGHLFHRYRADFLISYQVDGTQYRRWVSGNGLDPTLFRDQVGEEDILSQYDVGTAYTCSYNPQDPESAYLVARHNWLSSFTLIAPAVIFVVVLYFFVHNLFWFAKRKYRKKNSKG